MVIHTCWNISVNWLNPTWCGWVMFLMCCWISLASYLLSIFASMCIGVWLFSFLFLCVKSKMILDSVKDFGRFPPFQLLLIVWKRLDLVCLKKFGRIKHWSHLVLGSPLLQCLGPIQSVFVNGLLRLYMSLWPNLGRFYVSRNLYSSPRFANLYSCLY